jgi:hypothetical protein
MIGERTGSGAPASGMTDRTAQVPGIGERVFTFRMLTGWEL